MKKFVGSILVIGLSLIFLATTLAPIVAWLWTEIVMPLIALLIISMIKFWWLWLIVIFRTISGDNTKKRSFSFRDVLLLSWFLKRK